MERYLIKTSTWKTIDNSYSRSFAEKSFVGKKSTPKATALEKPTSRRLSIRDDKLMKIFCSLSDQPLIDDCNKSQREIFKSLPSGICNENTSPNVNANCQAVCRQPSKALDLQQSQQESMSTTPTNPIERTEDATPKENPYFARLQKDLNSPSANARVRAMKALKSPTKSGYYHFDVPHEEQDIITAEERRSPIRPKSIQEVMKDVVVYVEVRTGEDNRSAGVRKVISLLGARVNDRFLRDTTHVVFKDGLQSTFNKAKKWNIPIVSILWIEACKTHMMLMSPKLYPISNFERYENPELYTKLRRQKSMQPDAENVRRNRTKLLNKKTEVNKTVEISSSLRIPRKPKDKLDEILLEFRDNLMSTPENNEDFLKLDSKLLQRIRNSPFTPPIKKNQNSPQNSLHKLATSTISEDSDDDFEQSRPTKTSDVNAKKALNFDKTPGTDKTIQNDTVAPPKKSRRRSSSITISKKVEKEQNESNQINTKIQRPRRSSISTYSPYAEMNITHNDRLTKIVGNTKKTVRPKLTETIIMEENCDIDETVESQKTNELNDIVKNIRGRETSFTQRPLDITEPPTNSNTKPTPIYSTPANQNGRRRRTLYTPQLMESSVKEFTGSCSTTKKNRRRTCFSASVDMTFADKDLNSNSVDNTNTNNVDKVSISDNWPPSLRKSNRRQTIFNPLCAAKEFTDNTIDISSTTSSQTAESNDLQRNKFQTPTTKPTIIEEHSASLTFNSLKTPSNSKRKTIFDISMDIIEQRLQNINKSAKLVRSISEDSRRAENIEDENVSKITPTQNIQSSLEPILKDTNPSLTKTSTSNASTSSLPRKRKLFVPQDLLLTPQKGNSPVVSTPVTKSNKKRQRDEINSTILSAEKKSKSIEIDSKALDNISTITKMKVNRRSTLDFEQKKKLKKSGFPVEKGQTKLPFLVYTNMHTEQIKVIEEAVQQLGGFKLKSTVNDCTTHIITLEPRRTINLLRGIIRGLWILNYNWILESMRKGKWQYEEPYEVQNFSRAVEICRSERQAFGPGYKIDLFTDISPIYVSVNCSVPYKNIKELIKLCSGHIVDRKDDAKYIIGEFCLDVGKICVEPIWILDSITDNQIKKVGKYLLCKV